MSNLATITNNILADSGIDDLNVIVSTGSYSNPAWITALSWSKITGSPAFLTSVTASSPLASSGGTTPNITIQQASGSQSGFLSSTDWTTFNNKQNALTNPVTGTGTTNYLAKFTGSTTVGNSIVQDNGSAIIASGNIQTSGSSNHLRAGNYTWVGGSGGDYGSVGYNIGYTTTSLTYNYVVNDFSSALRFDTGGFRFLTAPSGTAGNAITFTQAMTLTNAGYLVLGGTSSVYGQAGRGTFEMNGSADNIFAMRVGGSLTGYLYTNASSMEIYSTNRLDISTAGAVRASVTTGGNLLVGTTTDAGQRLQVSGSIYLLTGGNRNIRIGSATNYYYDLQSTNDDFQIIEAGSTPRLTIKYPNGNVGIGTASPLTKLMVQDSANTYVAHFSGLNQANGIAIGTNSSNVAVIQGYTRTFSATNFISMQGDGGNISIGSTTDTGYKLFVNGNTYIRSGGNTSGSFGLVVQDSSANNMFLVRNDGAATFSSSVTAGGNVLVPAGSGLAWVGDSSRIMTPEDNVSGALIQTPGIIRLNAGGSERMRITSSGNVLIGTTTDNSHKLRVNGTGYFDTGIKTGNPVGSTTNDWLLGRALVSGTSTPDRWIRVQIGNLYYDILAVYMGSV